MSTEWETTTKYIVGVALVIFGIFVLYISRSILALLTISALIAFLIRPLIGFLSTRLRFPRTLAVIVTYLLAVAILMLAPLILIPSILSAVRYFAELDYQILINDLFQWTESSLLMLKDSGFQVLGLAIYLDSTIDPILAILQNTSTDINPSLPSLPVIVDSIGSAFSVSFGVAVGVVGSVTSGILAFIYLIFSGIYLSLSGDKVQNGLLSFFPTRFHDEIETLLERLKTTWDAFFRGQITLMLIIGFLVWVGATLLGLPGAFPLAVISGLLEIIPNLGPFLATIPAVVIALLQGSTWLPVNNFVFALIVIVFYILIQQFENVYIVPRVLGDAVELHPLIIMTGVLVGASVWGILGALLAAPVIASARLIILYLHCKVTGAEPFPPSEQTIPPPPFPKPDWVKDITGKVKQLVRRQPQSGDSPGENSEEKDKSQDLTSAE